MTRKNPRYVGAGERSEAGSVEVREQQAGERKQGKDGSGEVAGKAAGQAEGIGVGTFHDELQWGRVAPGASGGDAPDFQDIFRFGAVDPALFAGRLAD